MNPKKSWLPVSTDPMRIAMCLWLPFLIGVYIALVSDWIFSGNPIGLLGLMAVLAGGAIACWTVGVIRARQVVRRLRRSRPTWP